MASATLQAAFDAELSGVRALLAAPAQTPLEALHALLDATVASTPRRNRRGGNATLGTDSALRLRTGSVAAHAEQVAAYASLAMSLGRANVSVCEVGFNAGHSAAVWLSSNPHLTLHTFDFFGASDRAMRRCLDVLTRTFPGRLVAHAGDSLRVVGSLATKLEPPCALVHVDGRHSYFNVLADAMQLSAHTTGADALYLFDDQCTSRGTQTLVCRSRSEQGP